MAQIIATRDMTVNGKDYERGQSIPTKDLPPGRLDQLIRLRRVVEDKVTVKTRGD